MSDQKGTEEEVARTAATLIVASLVRSDRMTGLSDTTIHKTYELRDAYAAAILSAKDIPPAVAENLLAEELAAAKARPGTPDA